MNGQDLLEALNCVDDEYILEAEVLPKVRRFRWQPIAAMAACLALVLIGYRSLPLLMGQQAKIEMAVSETSAASGAVANDFVGFAAKRSDEDAVAEEAEVGMDMIPMMISAWSEMSVKFLRYEDGVAVCIVTDPGTSGLEVGAEVRLQAELPMEAYDDTASYAESPVFSVLYTPEETQDGIIIPVSVTEEEQSIPEPEE